MTCLLLRNVDHALFENVNKRCQQQVSVSVSRCFAAGSGCQLSTSSVVSVDASQKSDARMPASDSPTDNTRSPTPIPWWSDEVDRISPRPQYNGSWPYEIRHTRQCGTHAFTPLSSRTNVYKYSYFPTLQNCCRVSTGNGVLFLTQPVQHHLPIPSVQHSTDYPPLHPTPTASSMTIPSNTCTLRPRDCHVTLWLLPR